MNQTVQTKDRGGAITGAAEYFAAFCATFFYIQAHRDVVISPGGFDAVKWIVYVAVASPLLAGLLNLLPLHGLFAFLSGLAVVAGRVLMLRPDIASYYWGEYLVIGGFWFYFVSALMCVKADCQKRSRLRLSLAFFSAGVLTAPILHLGLRASNQVENNGIVLALAAVMALCALADALIPSRGPEGGEASRPEEKGSWALAFAVLALSVPFHYLFQWALNPEMFSGVAGVPYAAAAGGVKAALFAAAAVCLLGAGARSAAPLNWFSLVMGAVALAALGLLFRLPERGESFALILVALFGVALSFYAILAGFMERRIPARGLILGLAGFASVWTTFGLRVYLLEHHDPSLHLKLAGLLCAALALVCLKTRRAAGVGGKVLAVPAGYGPAVAFALFVALAAALSGMKYPKIGDGRYDRKVVATLYNWYGAPGKAFGMQGWEDLQKPADPTLWDAGGSTAPGVEILQSVWPTSDAGAGDVQGGGTPTVLVRSETGGRDKNRMSVHGSFNSPALAASRNYFHFGYGFDPGGVKAVFYFRKSGARHSVELAPFAGDLIRDPKELMFSEDARIEDDFQSEPSEGPDEIGFEIDCIRPGRCDFFFGAVAVSRWRHWDEDFHTAEVNGVWRNDPPDGIAAAHHAGYDGKPWPDIRPYGDRGVYDSWDPDVLRSQIRLMEKAGLDALVIMHPNSMEFVDLVFRTLEELDSPLQAAWWNSYENPESGSKIVEKWKGDPHFLKVTEDRPAWFVGPTGLLEKPYKIYEKEFAELRRQTNAFLIGDQYAPPKEEMLGLMDGHYYYDTTGLYRARWGGKAIEVAQPDGTFVVGHGHLDRLFKAISNLTHARNQLFVATVIPGFDNTAVHGFTGTPLHDGRPGTVVKRHDGEAYAETWRAAIRSRADWACIVSWNELHEGTEIEPTEEDGVFYVNETKKWADAFRAGRLEP